MTWFVAVPVCAYTPPDVVCAGDILGELYLEERVEALCIALAPYFVYMSLYIMRDIPCVLHGKSLGNVAPSVHRARTFVCYWREGGAPAAL